MKTNPCVVIISRIQTTYFPRLFVTCSTKYYCAYTLSEKAVGRPLHTVDKYHTVRRAGPQEGRAQLSVPGCPWVDKPPQACFLMCEMRIM